MTTQEAYDYQTNRLTEEQKIQLNLKERNIGRPLQPYEIVTIFGLELTGELKTRRRRTSDSVEERNWADQ